MLVQFLIPYQLSPSQLDSYLAQAWFRAGATNMLYKSKLICANGQLYSLINTRLALENYTYSKSLRKILKNGLQNFSYKIQAASVDSQRERLYQLHKKRFMGYVMPSLESFFEQSSPFQTYEVAIFDKKKLVALSFFDVGSDSVASLLGLFDSQYASHSLGMLSMLLEIGYSLENQKKYYYPGYVLHRPSVFDYKFRLGKLDFYDWKSKNWSPDFPKSVQLADLLLQKISSAQEVLLENQINSNQVFYPPFSLGYLSQYADFLVSGSVFLLLSQRPNLWLSALILEYVFEKNCYRLSVVHHCQDFVISSFDYQDQTNQDYYLEVLSYDRIVIEDQDITKILPKIVENLALSYFEKIKNIA